MVLYLVLIGKSSWNISLFLSALAASLKYPARVFSDAGQLSPGATLMVARKSVDQFVLQ
jgi:hypothetical protein